MSCCCNHMGVVKRAWDNLHRNKIMTFRQIESIAEAQSHRTFVMLELSEAGLELLKKQWSEMGRLKLQKLVLQWKSTIHFFFLKCRKEGQNNLELFFRSIEDSLPLHKTSPLYLPQVYTYSDYCMLTCAATRPLMCAISASNTALCSSAIWYTNILNHYQQTIYKN